MTTESDEPIETGLERLGEAIELAYGLLWLCRSDRASRDGERVYQALQALLPHLDRDARARGISIALDFDARRNSRGEEQLRER